VPTIPVTFGFYLGLPSSPLLGATLLGSWDDAGIFSADRWSAKAMTARSGPGGLAAFSATVPLDSAEVGTSFAWGVQVRRADGATVWGIPAEVDDPNSQLQHRTFTLAPPSAASAVPQRESYRLAWHRTRGAQCWMSAGIGPQAITFSVWAPNATAAEVVFGGPSGYVDDAGGGLDPALPALPMFRRAGGIWAVMVEAGFDEYIGRRYLYRVTRDDGRVVYATDMFSRQQAGTGDLDPGGDPYSGTPASLDGRPSCSVVVDPRRVEPYPSAPSGQGAPASGQASSDYWADEFDPAKPVPRRVEDLVIYELHVGALNPTAKAAGTFADAIDLVPYLEELGVNAVELMPMFQFDGTLSWGYGSSHFLAIESAAGGRDGLAQFVKTCHQHGIAVLMDVVYNHYTPQAARAAWQYDSAAPDNNVYYWYEGSAASYPDPAGGYLDNDSSGWAPRYHDAHVRTLFVSSAVALLDEFHIDGLRVDQTASIHAYNSLHADGRPVGTANIAGRKFLRELCQTMKTIQPAQMLIAEDHSGWAAVTQSAFDGGIGFDATWYVDFYHHLVGEKGRGPEWAKLLLNAGLDPVGPLPMDYFAGALGASGANRVVYQSSHDEAGNDAGTERTILVAVNGAPLVGDTRRYAEARSRFAFGVTMLSAGTPMFLMGEEVGAEKAYTYDKFFEEKEDLEGLRRTTGASLFRFFSDIIGFRLETPALRSHNIEIVAADNHGRVIAFRRWDDDNEFLVVASLDNDAYDQPSYVLTHPTLGNEGWRECFNSDSSSYGGANVGNLGATLRAVSGSLGVVVPANGLVVLVRTA
jgi:1,4-alpha-glucan branching enzyme